EPGAIEATRFEGERLEPEMAAGIAVDAHHDGMAGLPVPPPARDAGAGRRGELGVGLREDRRELGPVAHVDELAAVEPPQVAEGSPDRPGDREEALRVSDEAGIAVKDPRAGEARAERGAVTRHGKGGAAEVALEHEAVEPGAGAEHDRLEAG